MSTTPEKNSNNLTLADMKKANLKLAVSVFLRTLLSALLCFIVYMSIVMVVTGLTTKTIGTQIYETGSDGKAVLIYEETFASTTQTTVQTVATSAQAASTEVQGAESSDVSDASDAAGETTASTLPSNQYSQPIRSEVPHSATVAMNILSQVMMLLLYVSIPYSLLWMQGDKDSNMVHFKHMPEDTLRGLKVGLMAAIPSFAFYVVLLLSKLGVVFPNYFFLYRFLNIAFLPLMSAFTGTAASATVDVPWLGIGVILLTLAVLPAVCHLAYTLGYKHISISEKIIYVDPAKKKKKRRY